MIEDNELINKEELPVDYSADYWEKRYSIQRDRVPTFLEKFTQIIMRTGKYLNVISQCGKPITKTNTEQMKYSLSEQNYSAIIQKAHAYASKFLLELLMKEYDLMGRLRTVKNYFLMSQGDFIVQFMDATEQELSKNIDDVIPSKLESLLGLCLRLSAASHDPYNEDMRVELFPYDLYYQMCKIHSIETKKEEEFKEYKDKQNKENKEEKQKGVDIFSFGMEVKWPVSLVLNHRAIACYQMLFRHLFYCKHVERLLCKVWLNSKVVKRFSEARGYYKAFALRQRMLTCMQHLQYYMCVEVIEPLWTQLIQSLEKFSNFDIKDESSSRPAMDKVNTILENVEQDRHIDDDVRKQSGLKEDVVIRVEKGTIPDSDPGQALPILVPHSISNPAPFSVSVSVRALGCTTPPTFDFNTATAHGSVS
ncbi:Gamma-tubulin complex component 2 homolog [Eumeta japonica]|uniref:Gamma-tubulin complex component n=1 Tax=Eumeta variegata TaxID=151549 RepID=A0A4C1SXF6_EUMVA|nr:Gamma-tubulin complex component 2 homolog [Eumeta japonica]